MRNAIKDNECLVETSADGNYSLSQLGKHKKATFLERSN
jgi:hypothetical protein